MESIISNVFLQLRIDNVNPWEVYNLFIYNNF